MQNQLSILVSHTAALTPRNFLSYAITQMKPGPVPPDRSICTYIYVAQLRCKPYLYSSKHYIVH